MANPLNTPQFAMPFRIVGDSVACIEQDSETDRVQNAITVMRYRPGDRSGLLDFGIPDPVFRQGGMDLDDLAFRIRRWEPDLEIQDLTQSIDNEGVNLVELTFRHDPQEQ